MTASNEFFYIPEANFSKFEKAMSTLSKRSVRYTGHPVDFYIFGHEYRDGPNDTKIKYIEIFIEGDAPTSNGWEFVARIDHAPEAGNIIRSVPNISCEIPTKYRDIAPNCDHCNVKRLRRDTFLLHNKETKEFQQIGSSCIDSFFNGSATGLAKRAELLAYAREAAEACQTPDNNPQALINFAYVSLEDYLGYAAAVVREHGWLSRTQAKDEGRILESTSEIAKDFYFGIRHYADFRGEEDMEVARAAIEWANSLADRANLNDYQHNILAVSGSVYVEVRSLGIAASIIPGYLKHRERELEYENKRKATEGSQFIGEIGGKVEFNGKIIAHHHGEGQYGYYYSYKFLTDDGNVVSWFATKSVNIIVGTRVSVKGSIKAHKEYKGIKETTITRAKVERL